MKDTVVVDHVIPRLAEFVRPLGEINPEKENL